MILTHFDHLMIYYFAEDGMIKEIKDIDKLLNYSLNDYYNNINDI